MRGGAIGMQWLRWAVGSRQAGHDVEVYEQAPQLGEVGAGIQISANAMHVLRHLGLAKAITKAGVRPNIFVDARRAVVQNAAQETSHLGGSISWRACSPSIVVSIAS